MNPEKAYKTLKGATEQTLSKKPRNSIHKASQQIELTLRITWVFSTHVAYAFICFRGFNGFVMGLARLKQLHWRRRPGAHIVTGKRQSE